MQEMDTLKALLCELVTAHNKKDDIQLQKLEAEIIDEYNASTISDRAYRALLAIQQIFRNDLRKER